MFLEYISALLKMLAILHASWYLMSGKIHTGSNSRDHNDCWYFGLAICKDRIMTTEGRDPAWDDQRSIESFRDEGFGPLALHCAATQLLHTLELNTIHTNATTSSQLFLNWFNHLHYYLFLDMMHTLSFISMCLWSYMSVWNQSLLHLLQLCTVTPKHKSMSQTGFNRKSWTYIPMSYPLRHATRCNIW